VSRHVLRPEGSTFVCEDSDFVVSDNVDFHPTDVLMDADGSLLVVDTGGWYKLCCPTSQLWKPDVLGGIYRVRRTGAKGPADPRGLNLHWSGLTVSQLWRIHADVRPAVRQRASREFVRRADTDQVREFVAGQHKADIAATIGELPRALEGELTDADTAALARLWTLAQLNSTESRALIRQLLHHKQASVRHAALNAVSLLRDAEAYSDVVRLLKTDEPANRRAAAEVLGRLGNGSAVPQLLAAAADASHDRILQHSITYALIELADADAIREGLTGKSVRTQATALVALDQMPHATLDPRQVMPLLNCSEDDIRKTARWLVSRHVEWGEPLSAWFEHQLTALRENGPASESSGDQSLEAMLADFAVNPAVRRLMIDTLSSDRFPTAAKQLVLRAMSRANPGKAAPKWRAALADTIAAKDASALALAIEAARHLPEVAAADDRLNRSLKAIADAPDVSQPLRVAAISVAAASLTGLQEKQFAMLLEGLSPEQPVATRSAAADALAKAPLTEAQLEQLCAATESASPLELNRLLDAYAKVVNDELGAKLLASLKASAALPSLRIDLLRASLSKYGPGVQKGIDELESMLNVDAAAQRERIETLLPRAADGDVRRGHAVFYSAKASCSACHRMGNAGGVVGPELTRIGDIRTERDLLESILYPSKSFVRSYEPMQVFTVDGRVINGTVRDETEKAYLIATGPNQEVRLARDEVEEIAPSTVSVMPSGLDGQLSETELADLVAFLKNPTGR
jgi:putative heme-binding domain-containing protein